MTTIHNGDCIEVMNQMPPESVDAIVTDPPYGLGFMGKKWDGLPPSLEWAEACYRVLKPGGHIAAFGGTRTWHRLAVAIEDAGFEMRDSLAWLYGSGFPKSHDVGKAIDKLDASDERQARALEFTAFIRESGLTARRIDELTGTNMGGHFTTAASQPAVATAELFDKLRPHLPEVPERIEELVAQRTVESQNFKAREVVGKSDNGIAGGTGKHAGHEKAYGFGSEFTLTAPAAPEAVQWDGWGTALKPAFEPIVLARKPLAEKTVARNVLAHGTGAINIDATRIATGEELRRPFGTPSDHVSQLKNLPPGELNFGSEKGRWPANVLLDQHAAAWVDEQSGITQSPTSTGRGAGGQNGMYSPIGGQGAVPAPGDKGGASRFFYVTGREGGTVGPCAPANTAAPSSSQPSDPVDTAPGGAATSASHGGPSMSPGSSAPSTNAAPTGSRLNDASSTQTTLPIGNASSPERQPAAPSPSGSPASSVASPESATMRTMSSPSSSSGTAGDTTSSGTSSSTAPGAQGFPGDELGARFMYSAKAPKSERPNVDGVQHPTVKPLAIMRWLIRLVTPPGGTVLDPFAGSGTTIEAALIEGFNPVGIELEAEYLPLIQHRIDRQAAQLDFHACGPLADFGAAHSEQETP